MSASTGMQARQVASEHRRAELSLWICSAGYGLLTTPGGDQALCGDVFSRIRRLDHATEPAPELRDVPCGRGGKVLPRGQDQSPGHRGGSLTWRRRTLTRR